MNWDTMKGDWKKFSGQIREWWGDLTDNEVEAARGRREQFEGMLQRKYGIAREEAKRQIDAFERSCHCS